MTAPARATNCHQCKGAIRGFSVTLPRKAGDMTFCRWICYTRWAAKQEGNCAPLHLATGRALA